MVVSAAVHANPYHAIAALLFALSVAGLRLLAAADELSSGSPWKHVIHFTDRVSLLVLGIATFGPIVIIAVGGEPMWDVMALGGVLLVWWTVLDHLVADHRRILKTLGRSRSYGYLSLCSRYRTTSSLKSSSGCRYSRSWGAPRPCGVPCEACHGSIGASSAHPERRSSLTALTAPRDAVVSDSALARETAHLHPKCDSEPHGYPHEHVLHHQRCEQVPVARVGHVPLDV